MEERLHAFMKRWRPTSGHKICSNVLLKWLFQFALEAGTYCRKGYFLQ